MRRREDAEVVNGRGLIGLDAFWRVLRRGSAVATNVTVFGAVGPIGTEGYGNRATFGAASPVHSGFGRPGSTLRSRARSARQPS
jgi:hypothetical protein